VSEKETRRAVLTKHQIIDMKSPPSEAQEQAT